MTPTIGQIVHVYKPGEAPCLAAIVVDVLESGLIEATVFAAGRAPSNLADLPEGPDRPEDFDSWHWPE